MKNSSAENSDATFDPVTSTGKDAAILSLIEIGLGSLLHSFRVPMTGFFLSLNEGFILSRTTLSQRGQKGDRFSPLVVSNIAALLKSLSPAGKKLTPMLAISAQGFLFAWGTLIFGANLVGILVGSVIASLWSFAQPVLIYLMIFGRTFVDVVGYYYKEFQQIFDFPLERLLFVLVAFVLLKVVLAIALAFVAYFLPEHIFSKYQNKMLKMAAKKTSPSVNVKSGRSAIVLAMRDLWNPLFIVSLALTLVFFMAVESSGVAIFWGLMRPIAIGFILFYLVRVLPFTKLIEYFRRLGFSRFAASFEAAISFMKEVGRT